MAKVVIVIIITAAITLFVTAIFFLFFYRLAMARKHRENKLESVSHRVETITAPQEFRQQGGTLKGIIVDEDGVEVLYVKKMEKGKLMGCFSRVWVDPMKVEEEEKRIDRKYSIPKNSVPIQEMPLLHDLDFSNNHDEMSKRIVESSSSPPPPPPPPPAPPPPTKAPVPPPPPPGQEKRAPGLPPPPPKAGGLMKSSLKPPPAPKWKTGDMEEKKIGEGEKGGNDVQMKLKPLHWDKVNIANAEQSMIWNEINDGSLRFDDELIDALFGYTPANTPGSSRLSTSATPSTNPPAQIFILEPRKSQNTAIVLKSLAISRKEVLDSLLEGQGLNSDILEKLMRISPSQEEITKILQFNGNPTKLANAESFLYYTLKALPSAFIRISAMLFRSNYDSEILHLKESLQTLELGCKELRTRGIFFKLLEAILKAGNHMNAGTSRGDAQGFNLNALRKLSYVKSTDGKTTLLHFVVEQVVRDEGKRYAVSRSHSLVKRDENGSSSDGLRRKEERDKEYLTSGLPVLSGLNINFSNVKKAATIDYDSFISMLPNLTTRIGEIRKLVTSCGNNEKGGFAREMKGFLEECEAELRVVREEQSRIMDIVKRTTSYYQAGSSERGVQPLHLFVIVKDFLGMVDQVSLDITKKIKKMNIKLNGTSQQTSSPTKNPVRFQNFQSQFMGVKPGASSSDSEDDF